MRFVCRIGLFKLFGEREMQWPKTVPILSATDMCRDQVDGPDKTHCLVGHKLVALGNSMLPYPAIEQACSEVDGTYDKNKTVSVFNDDRKNSLALVARVWNRAMYLLGYTEGNPESKPLKRRQK